MCWLEQNPTWSSFTWSWPSSALSWLNERKRTNSTLTTSTTPPKFRVQNIWYFRYVGIVPYMNITEYSIHSNENDQVVYWFTFATIICCASQQNTSISDVSYAETIFLSCSLFCGMIEQNIVWKEIVSWVLNRGHILWYKHILYLIMTSLL